MTATTHQLFGFTFGMICITTLNVFQWIPEDTKTTVIFFSLVLLGSLLPDLDHPKSKLGSKFPFFFISYPLYWLFGHRTWTHSFMFVVITGFLGMTISSSLFAFGRIDSFVETSFIGLALAIGALSHVIGDYCFDGGVPLFHPFIKRRYKFIITAKTKQQGSFSISESLVSLTLAIVNVYMIYNYWDIGYLPF